MANTLRPFRFFVNHWKGRNSLVLTALFSVLALSIMFSSLISLWAPQIPITIGLACVVGLGLVIWQVVGTVRAAENHAREYSDFVPIWMSYGALLFGAIYTISALIGPVVGRYTPAPYVAPIAKEVTTNGHIVRIDGNITLLVNTTIKNMLKNDPTFRSIELKSDGGSIHAARGLATTIQEHQMDTIAIGPCRSACTLVFIAGKTRKVAPDGSLGFHSYRIDLPNYSGGKDPEQEETRDALLFEAQGVSADFINKMYKAPHSDLWTPTHAELREAGLITP